MKRKNQLKGTKIYLNNDLTYRERRNKKKDLVVCQTKREEGSEVKIGYNKVSINKEEVRYDEWRDKLFRRKEAQRTQPPNATRAEEKHKALIRNVAGISRGSKEK